MSVRLNIVVVQSPKLTSLQTGITADIVIQLLGRPGLDVALIKSLTPDQDHPTDQLMLTSLESDLAIIDWRDAEKMMSDLVSLGIHAGRTRHELDAEGEPAIPGRRRVYLFDLRQGHKAMDVINTLTKILERRQVVTVSLLTPRPKTIDADKPTISSVSDDQLPSATGRSVSIEDLVDQLNEIDL